MSKALTARSLNGNSKRAWELFLQDYTQQEIASELGISQPRVSQILQAGAAELEARPRDIEMRTRVAQVEAKISYWQAIATDESRPMGVRVAADKRVGFWYDFRARLNAEYAPASIYVDGMERQTIHYQIEGLDPKALE